MQICPADDIFFGSIDIEDIDYVAIMNKSYITGMDPKNVVQVCFNYAVTMHNAISNINHEWPYVYWQWCVVHYWTCCSKFGRKKKQSWVKNNVDKSKIIINYIWTHQCLTTTFLITHPIQDVWVYKIWLGDDPSNDDT